MRLGFDIHCETLNSNPETRVTIVNVEMLFKCGFLCAKSTITREFNEQFMSELQKTLATYH